MEITLAQGHFVGNALPIDDPIADVTLQGSIKDVFEGHRNTN